MADHERKPVLHVVPAILTGAAALIASLTAIYVNMRNDNAEPLAPAAATATPATAMPVVDKPAPPVPVDLALQLDRIAVVHDGAIGTADWRFAVEADDQPLFVFAQDDLDDSGGRNVVVPDKIGSHLRLMPGTTAKIVVKAWRSRRLRLTEGPPDAIGQGTLAASGAIAPLEVAAEDPAKAAFTFYFSTAPRVPQ